MGDKNMGVRDGQNELARPVRKDGEGEQPEEGAERDEEIQVPGRCKKRKALESKRASVRERVTK